MTGIGRDSSGPPWSVDLLADLQAGVLDPQQASDLRRLVDADPEAQEILAALEATEADLREFAHAPAPPMPAHFAARLDAAIAAESQARAQSFVPQQQQREPQFAGAAPGSPPGQPAPVTDLAEARKRRNRKMGIGVGIFAAAAAAAGIAFAVLPGNGGSAGDVAAQGPLTFKAEQIGKDQLQAARNQNDYGPFADKQKLSACLAANGLSPTAEPIGGKQVTVDGKQGTLLVLSSGAGEFRLLAVGPDCGPGNPSTLANRGGVR
ncbi:hypothetical protein JOF56_002244 [Kibdelosporangium banguiense]|uniref:Anti-sigma factor n=1 Tax=Kibdelosporangium banguiense TaxID=1365924 RepID=A0ABS4TC02_9PSEU|nr:hypothetical protein [Kibdelosporangium banguiense]MBP2321859.1 hypothetical protein [Kibdelosporangium banguiense]